MPRVTTPIASPKRIGPDRHIVRAEQRRAGAGNLIQQRRVVVIT